MIRVRFLANLADFRPVVWPVKHPYWCTGYASNHSVVVAYADDIAQVLKQWPEAREIEAEEVQEYQFTSRFPKPSWVR